MHPKMPVKYASDFLGCKEEEINQKLEKFNLNKIKAKTPEYFGYKEAKEIFNLNLTPKIISFQIVKGGTGKTSLASSFAVRANLFGLKVLCIDLDQQANLTQSFNIDASGRPVLIDILAEEYSYLSSITQVMPGLDILPSRIENALLDDVIKLKKIDIDKAYALPFAKLKNNYDLIVIDCPPNLGKSVAAATLASDLVIAPVVADSFALSGLEIIANTIRELEAAYQKTIPFKIILNKYDTRTNLAKDAIDLLRKHEVYSKHIIDGVIRMSQDFPNAVINNESIFDNLSPSNSKDDIDIFTRRVLGLNPIGSLAKQKTKFTVHASFKEEELL